MTSTHDTATPDFAACYKALGLAAPCDWTDVKLAYRRRVHDCHPDLGEPGNSPGWREAEFDRVVRAYRTLAAYYRANGSLPDCASMRGMPALHGTARRSRQHAGRMRFPGWRDVVPRLHQAAFALFIAGVGTAALLGRMHANPPVEAGGGDGKLSIGMEPMDVVNVQGVPHYTKGSVWFYGESGVVFDRGCVIGWENQPPFPLRTLVQNVYLAGRSNAGFSRRACDSAAD